MLSQSTKMAELEARVAKLEKENKTLDNIKNDLSEANSELKRNNVLLTNTCSDLAQQVDKLEKRAEDNLGASLVAEFFGKMIR